MLLATPGQATTTYKPSKLHRTASATQQHKKPCHPTAASTTFSMANPTKNSVNAAAAPATKIPTPNKQNAPHIKHNNNNNNNQQHKTNRSHTQQNNNNHVKRIDSSVQSNGHSHEPNVSSASNIIKTLSVRLNRGTEFLKDTVQKAINAGSVNALTAAATVFGSNGNLASASSSLTKFNASKPVAVKCGTPSTSCGATTTEHEGVELFSIVPTDLHRSKTARERTSLRDSLTKEMCHFKPIRTVPLTPLKVGSKSRGPSLKTPKVIRTVKACDSGASSLSDKPNLQLIDKDLYTGYKPKATGCGFKTVLTDSQHRSAFVCLFSKLSEEHMKCYAQEEPPQKKRRTHADNQLPVRKRHMARIAAATPPPTKKKRKPTKSPATARMRKEKEPPTKIKKENEPKIDKNNKRRNAREEKHAEPAAAESATKTNKKRTRQAANKRCAKCKEKDAATAEISAAQSRRGDDGGKNLNTKTKDCSESKRRGKLVRESKYKIQIITTTTATSPSDTDTHTNTFKKPSPPLTRARLKALPQKKLREPYQHTTQRGKF